MKTKAKTDKTRLGFLGKFICMNKPACVARLCARGFLPRNPKNTADTIELKMRNLTS